MIVSMTLKKHIIKRITIFTSILAMLFLLFYAYCFITIDEFLFFEFFIVLFFFIFFSIAFLIFEASELKIKKQFENRKFNLLTGGALTLFLIMVLVWFVWAAACNF